MEDVKNPDYTKSMQLGDSFTISQSRPARLAEPGPEPEAEAVAEGELDVEEIKNLVSQHVFQLGIIIVDNKTREQLIYEIEQKGYTIDHGQNII